MTKAKESKKTHIATLTRGGLPVVGELTRKCLAIDAAGSIRSKRVIEVLSRLVSQRGAPRLPRSGNGPEYVSKAILEWIVDSYI